MEVMLKISKWFEKLKTIRFQGKPVKIEPLINSKIPKVREKIKKELTIFTGLKIMNIYETNP